MIWTLITFIAIIVLWIIGGQLKGRIRDVGVCILLAFYCSLHLWKLLPFLTGLSANIIRLGYGNYEENDDKHSFLALITKDKNGWWIRLFWGLLVGLILPIFLYKQLGIVKYTFYIAINALTGFLVSKLRLPVLLTDILIGGAVGLIVFLI